MGWLSTSERVFLAALCGFYNGDWGAELLREYCRGYECPGDIANRLDLDELQIITDLMLSHTGW
jgi:hypothetical protein